MPLAAIQTGAIDTVAAPEELGRRLAELLGAGAPSAGPQAGHGTRRETPQTTGQREGT
jgi:hypothetical protein